MSEHEIVIDRRPLCDQILDRAHAADRALRQNPWYSRMLSGDATCEEYTAWLMQVHKYVRHTVRVHEGVAGAMAARPDDKVAKTLSTSSKRAAEDEQGHDDLILNDLSAIWGVSPNEALGRVERAAPAPSVLVWERNLEMMLAHFPAGMIGVALALETVAYLQADQIRDALIERGAIPAIEQGVSFLHEHSASVEGDHINGARTRANALREPKDRAAAFFYASSALAMYEGIAFYLNERFPATDAAPERPVLAGAHA